MYENYWKIYGQNPETKEWRPKLVANHKIAGKLVTLEKIYTYLLNTAGIETEDKSADEVYLSTLALFDAEPGFSIKATAIASASERFATPQSKQNWTKEVTLALAEDGETPLFNYLVVTDLENQENLPQTNQQLTTAYGINVCFDCYEQ